MPRALTRLAQWFGLEVVHVIVIRRSRHGGLRLIQSTFPSDHPTLQEEGTSSSKEGILMPS
ncbi:hypothetical protein N7508_007174 [Penicillium antarcticum]|uniref:uncharacterized protein n=1 Tax=Penicillium antarcticum TaxID=416450 RepID=UPI00238EEB06|nr:uncharacterized protein N7508_007174 [Penicillium antarcticum]KAJ5302311.1 hypothetical protein N7508_007174 [Penicillium antarcticum]